jgi:hypothetical protein
MGDWLNLMRFSIPTKQNGNHKTRSSYIIGVFNLTLEDAREGATNHSSLVTPIMCLVTKHYPLQYDIIIICKVFNVSF